MKIYRTTFFVDLAFTKKYLRMKNGFTLVELLVVIAIVGIMSGMMITAINPAKQFAKGRDATRKKDLAVLAAGLEQIYSKTNKYPVSENEAAGYESLDCLKLALEYGLTDCNKEGTPTVDGGVLKFVPDDPKVSDGLNYCYVVDANMQNYAICAWSETASNDEGVSASLTCTPKYSGRFSPYNKYCVRNPF